MSNRYYQTYNAWRRAIKSIAENNGRDFKSLLHGDKDIADCQMRLWDAYDNQNDNKVKKRILKIIDEIRR